MVDDVTSGIERAVFGAVARDDIDAWLSRHLRARLGGDLSLILFRSGRIAAVYGAAPSDGRQVVVKVRRGVADLAYISAAAACQRRLSEVGVPVPGAAGRSCRHRRLADRSTAAVALRRLDLRQRPLPRRPGQLLLRLGQPRGCSGTGAGGTGRRSFTEGSSAGAGTPTTAKVTGFLRPPGGLPASGSSLHALTTYRDAYLDLRW